MIDADESLNARWQSVSSLLEKAGFKNLPILPDANGTIIEQEFLPTFGVWIMPDNVTNRGMLEDFLEFTNSPSTSLPKCRPSIIRSVFFIIIKLIKSAIWLE